MKLCARCQQEKPADNFRTPGSKRCARCEAQQTRERRLAKNPRADVDRVLKWNRDNPEKYRAAKARKNARRRTGGKPGNPAKMWATRRANLAKRIPRWFETVAKTLRKILTQRNIRAAHRRWVAAHPEVVAFHNAKPHPKRRKHAPRKHELTLTLTQWQEIVSCFGGRCAYCGRADRPLTLDHVQALSHDGAHAPENVIPACKPCNSKKGSRGILSMVNTPWKGLS